MTIQEVIDKIHKYKCDHDFYHDYTEANNKLLQQHLGAFEAIVSEKDNKKYLIPEHGMQLHFLFRGQNSEFIPCVPSLYRGNMSEVEIFLNRMRLVVFERMLYTHPLVRDFFMRHNFAIDVEGLAQHYGIPSSILDLTSSLDVALFFATCKYNRDNDVYDYYHDDCIHEGILYLFDPILDNEPCPSMSLNKYLRGNITPIGLQAFPRPGIQEGYALHIHRGESLKCWMYRFTFTSADSKYYFDKFKSGESLWIHDSLIPITKGIVSQTDFSYDVFKETFSRYRPKGYSKTMMKRDLMNLSSPVYLHKEFPDVVFSKDEQNAIIREWNNGMAADYCQKIVRKPWFNNDRIDESTNRIEGIRNRHDFMTFEHLSERSFLDMVANVDSPYDAEWRNYTGSPRKTKSYGHYDSGWRKIDASFNTVYGSPWLTENDWLIDEV